MKCVLTFVRQDGEFNCKYNQLLEDYVDIFTKYTKKRNLFLTDKSINFDKYISQAYLYLYALSTWEQNDDGSTTDLYNYIDQNEVNRIILTLGNLLHNARKEVQ